MYVNIERFALLISTCTRVASAATNDINIMPTTRLPSFVSKKYISYCVRELFVGRFV